MNFNISGLGKGFQQIQFGKVYGLVATNPNWFDKILSSLTCENLVLLTYKDPSDSYACLLERTDINLTIFQLDQHKIDIKRLCFELTHQLKGKSLILMDFSDLIMTEKKSALSNVSLLKRFCGENGHSVMLLGSHSVNRDIANECWHELRGLMLVLGVDTPKSWHIHHWPIQGELYSQLEFDVVKQYPNLTLVERAKEEKYRLNNIINLTSVIVDRYYAELGDQINNEWLLTENTEQLKQQVLAFPESTVLLHVYQSDDLKELARLVYFLRVNTGKYLKIIINEVRFKLRLTEHRLLMNLGANIILPANLHIATLSSIIESTKNLISEEQLGNRFEGVYQSVNIPEVQGYLEPGYFQQNVKSMLNSATSLNIEFALIKLIVPLGVVPHDTVKYCQFNRAGDLYTIVGTSVYVFLYGCKEEHINSTLAFIFGTEVNLLFSAQEHYVYLEQTEIQLLKFAQDYEHASMFSHHVNAPKYEVNNVNPYSTAPSMPPFVTKPATLAELKLKKEIK